jgi:membrane protease YdiL (CAAX protease family)
MKSLFLYELIPLYLLTLLAIRLVVWLNSIGVHEVILAAVPFLFVYMPVWVCRYRKVDSYGYGLAVPAWGDFHGWWAGAKEALKLISVVIIPWLVGYHLYQSIAFGLSPKGAIPKDIYLLIPYHLFYVAIPEEFFYRGYFQGRLNELMPRPWNLFGVQVGWSLPITALFFAFGHSIVTFRWWHFAIFFPALAFGWLREKTQNTLAGAFFHAWCNISVAWLDVCYGLRS